MDVEEAMEFLQKEEQQKEREAKERADKEAAAAAEKERPASAAVERGGASSVAADKGGASSVAAMDKSKQARKPPRERNKQAMGVENPTPVATIPSTLARTTMIPPGTSDSLPPHKRIRTDGAEPSYAVPTIDQAEHFKVTSPGSLYIVTKAMADLAKNAREYVQWIEEVGIQNASLKSELEAKDKLIEEGKAELQRMKNEMTKLKTDSNKASTALTTVIASEKKVKEELRTTQEKLKTTQKSLEEADKVATDRISEMDKEIAALKLQQARAIDRGYKICLEHVKGTVPGFDPTGYQFASSVVDGKIVPYKKK